MKRILIISTVSRQFYLFEQANIEVLRSLGYEVHCAANYSDANPRLAPLDIIPHHFDIERSPFSLKNIKAYKQLKRIMRSVDFDVIHCHSPMGGALARLAAKSVGIAPVIYTAHGFHFYKGAPLLNWLVYYPVERLLSKYTNVLITINKEDYDRAQKLNSNIVVYIPGIGVDTTRFNDLTVSSAQKRNELKIAQDTLILVSVGEMVRRKNHETILKALAMIPNENFVYLICGRGVLESHLKNVAKSLHIENKVKFLGYRNDISELLCASDMFLFPSYQEGLPVSVMEAMSAGLPIICSSIRGNVELVADGCGGFLHEPEDAEGFANSIMKLIRDAELRTEMGKRNVERVKKFDKSVVKKEMTRVYMNISS